MLGMLALVDPSVALNVEPDRGREIEDGGKEGMLLLAGVPTGVEVAIGCPVGPDGSPR